MIICYRYTTVSEETIAIERDDCGIYYSGGIGVERSGSLGKCPGS